MGKRRRGEGRGSGGVSAKAGESGRGLALLARCHLLIPPLPFPPQYPLLHSSLPSLSLFPSFTFSAPFPLLIPFTSLCMPTFIISSLLHLSFPPISPFPSFLLFSLPTFPFLPLATTLLSLSQLFPQSQPRLTTSLPLTAANLCVSPP